MHHETYMRLYWEHHEAEREQLDGMWERLGKLENGVARRVCSAVFPEAGATKRLFRTTNMSII